MVCRAGAVEVLLSNGGMDLARPGGRVTAIAALARRTAARVTSPRDGPSRAAIAARASVRDVMKCAGSGKVMEAAGAKEEGLFSVEIDSPACLDFALGGGGGSWVLGVGWVAVGRADAPQANKKRLALHKQVLLQKHSLSLRWEENAVTSGTAEAGAAAAGSPGRA
jgi:hypothetical protein